MGGRLWFLQMREAWGRPAPRVSRHRGCTSPRRHTGTGEEWARGAWGGGCRGLARRSLAVCLRVTLPPAACGGHVCALQ